MTAYDDYLDLLEHMTPKQRENWEAAEYVMNQPQYEAPVTGRLDIGGYETVEIVDGGNCIHWAQRWSTWPYEQCDKPAGHLTDHEGVGLCYLHGGRTQSGRIQGATMMAHAFADEMDVTPWQALQSQVKLLAGQVFYLRSLVNAHERDHGAAAILPGGEFYSVTALLEARGDRLARVSKMAIDAGIAERFVRQIELEGAMMVQAASAMLDSIEGLDEDQRRTALEVMGAKLLELEAEEMTTA